MPRICSRTPATKEQSQFLLWTIFLLSSTGALHHTSHQKQYLVLVTEDLSTVERASIKVGDLYAVDVSSLSAEIHTCHAVSQQTLERMAVRLEVLLRQLNRLSDSNSMNIGDLLPQLVLPQLGRIVELFHTMSTYMPNVEPTSTLGRPKYVIDRAHLIECGFSCPRISHMLGVSE